MADVILNVEGTPLSGLATLVNWFSAAITWAGGLDPNSYPHDSLAGAHSLSTQGSAQFNSQFQWVFLPRLVVKALIKRKESICIHSLAIKHSQIH